MTSDCRAATVDEAVLGAVVIVAVVDAGLVVVVVALVGVAEPPARGEVVPGAALGGVGVAIVGEKQALTSEIPTDSKKTQIC